MVVGAAVSRIPFEIWLQIRDLIGPPYSESLYSVNRPWFEIVMNSRYRDLDLTRLNETVLSRLPLLKDAGIAKRIRHLTICGLTLQNSLLSTITGQRVKFPMDKNTLAILNRRIRALDVTSVLNPHVRLISEVISGLNASEYSVTWDFREGIQSGEIIHASLQGAILDVAWPAFGSSLKKLHVSTRPERFKAVLSSDVQLVRLEEIHLELLPTSGGAESIGIQDVFPEYVSSFFSRVNPNLDTLSIQSSSNLDLSCLFHHLPSFTNVHRLLLQILVGHGVLVDPSGLESFFAHSALRLRHLTLCLYHTAVSSSERVLPSLAMSRARIPRLETLEINFGMPCPELANTLLRELHDLFRGAHGTLHTLILEGIALSFPDLEAVTSAFADRDAAGGALRSLTVSVLTLTAQHIDTLAKNAPRINTLGIIFMHLSLVPDGPVAPEVECRLHFKTEIQAQEYPEWKLRDISIWHRSRSVDTSRWDLVAPFPACVPSITKFFRHPLEHASQAGAMPARMLSALAQG
ncbi:hypothetical protein K438DRAFT_1967079 [Mycena galopus ATCC 62051]|nr:hypothetical protein K438DRAFT_1967079 [Mycena galopus ATCC 62051]